MINMVADNSPIMTALLLVMHSEREKARRNAMNDLEMIDSMSRVSRGFGTFVDTVFSSDPKAGMVSEFFHQLAIEIEKDRPQAIKSYVNTFL